MPCLKSIAELQLQWLHSLVHLHPALQLWLQCMESGEWWGRGRGQGAGQQEVYLSDKHQQGTIREYSVWLALPHLQSGHTKSEHSLWHEADQYQERKDSLLNNQYYIGYRCFLWILWISKNWITRSDIHIYSSEQLLLQPCTWSGLPRATICLVCCLCPGPPTSLLLDYNTMKIIIE